MQWVFLALVSAFFSGMSDFFKKTTLKVENTFQFLTNLYIINFVLLLFAIPKISFSLSYTTLLTIFMRSFLLCVSMTLFTASLKHLPLSVASPLSNIKMVFGLILGIAILRETLNYLDIIGIIGILLGSYVIDTNGKLFNFRKQEVKLKYLLYFIGFGFFYAMSTLMIKFILVNTDSLNLLFYHSLFSMLIYLAIQNIFFGRPDLKKAKKDAWFILLIAIVGIASSYTQFLSLSYPESKLVIVFPLLQLSILIDVILGRKIFHEDHFKSHIIGTLVVIAGSLFIVL